MTNKAICIRSSSDITISSIRDDRRRDFPACYFHKVFIDAITGERKLEQELVIALLPEFAEKLSWDEQTNIILAYIKRDPRRYGGWEDVKVTSFGEGRFILDFKWHKSRSFRGGDVCYLFPNGKKYVLHRNQEECFTFGLE